MSGVLEPNQPDAVNEASTVDSVWNFTLRLAGGLEDRLDALFEAGCDDALFGSVDGEPYAAFERWAPSGDQAVHAAIAQVESVGLFVKSVESEWGSDPVTLRGTVITDDVAEEIAREAEVGYDLSQARHRDAHPR